MIKKLIYALRFMTILPLPWKENEDLVQVSRSSGMFPIVGLIIGTLLALTGRLIMDIFSGDVRAFLQMILWVFLTGGLHLDGLSDTFDGIGSRQKRERMLEIMKDSNIGAFGALSLILQLLLKYIFIKELNNISPWLIIIPPVTGRWGQLIAIYFYPSARKEGMGIFFRQHIRKNELIFALGTTILIYLLIMPLAFLSVLLGHGLIIILISTGISKMLKGLTGDVYGLVCELGESATLILTVLYASLFSTAQPLEGMNYLIHLFF
ncbi:MAG: adenosylcobinamide-GDP ribazoletransferase [Spirochaetaceae bacterium 4572_59]|nr:MAG: adenosylcobinamide-GDP ribazoletransferase [Spirochaetaceae bacterium 4572_59]